MSNAMRWMVGAILAVTFVPALAGEELAAPARDEAAQTAQPAQQGEAAEPSAPRTDDEGGGRGEPGRAAPRAEAAAPAIDAVEQWNQERFLEQIWTLE